MKAMVLFYTKFFYKAHLKRAKSTSYYLFNNNILIHSANTLALRKNPHALINNLYFFHTFMYEWQYRVYML